MVNFLLNDPLQPLQELNKYHFLGSKTIFGVHCGQTYCKVGQQCCYGIICDGKCGQQCCQRYSCMGKNIAC